MHKNKLKWKHNNPKPTGFSKSAKREIHSIKSRPQETRETSNKQPNFISKVPRKRRTPKLVEGKKS